MLYKVKGLLNALEMFIASAGDTELQRPRGEVCMRSKCVAAGLLASTFCLLFVSLAFAQSDRGTITGTVTDTTGSVVANVADEGGRLDAGAVFPPTTTA